MLKRDTIQKSYDKSLEEVQNKIKKIEKTFRQNPRKDIMHLKKREKTESTRECQNTKNIYEKTVITYNRQNERI